MRVAAAVKYGIPSGVLLIGILLTIADSFQISRRFRILVPLPETFETYLDFVGEGKTEKSGAKERPSVSREIRNAVEAAKNNWFAERSRRLRREQVEFGFFPEGFDDETNLRSFARAVGESEAEIVAVLGHVTSSKTWDFKDLYSSAKLPMVLPMASATVLPGELRSAGVPSVLRLATSNQIQALAAAHLVRRLETNSVVVFQDQANKRFSLDLLEQFAEALKETDTTPVNEKGEPTLQTFKVGATEPRGRIDLKVVEEADALLFFTMTSAALNILRDLGPATYSAKTLVFSDGAMDERLVDLIRKTTDIASVYFLLPGKELVPSAVRNVLLERDSDQEKRTLFTHAGFFVDGVEILLDALERKVVGSSMQDRPLQLFSSMKRCLQSGRSTTIDLLEEYVEAGRVRDVSPTYAKKFGYSFDGLGNNTAGHYHIHKMRSTHAGALGLIKTPLIHHDHETCWGTCRVGLDTRTATDSYTTNAAALDPARAQ